jgi:hypothetical protein
LLEIYAVGGEKSGAWISIGYVVGQIKLPPSFSDLWSQDEVSEDIALGMAEDDSEYIQEERR